MNRIITNNYWMNSSFAMFDLYITLNIYKLLSTLNLKMIIYKYITVVSTNFNELNSLKNLYKSKCRAKINKYKKIVSIFSRLKSRIILCCLIISGNILSKGIYNKQKSLCIKHNALTCLKNIISIELYFLYEITGLNILHLETISKIFSFLIYYAVYLSIHLTVLYFITMAIIAFVIIAFYICKYIDVLTFLDSFLNSTGFNNNINSGSSGSNNSSGHSGGGNNGGSTNNLQSISDQNRNRSQNRMSISALLTSGSNTNVNLNTNVALATASSNVTIPPTTTPAPAPVAIIATAPIPRPISPPPLSIAERTPIWYLLGSRLNPLIGNGPVDLRISEKLHPLYNVKIPYLYIHFNARFSPEQSYNIIAFKGGVLADCNMEYLNLAGRNRYALDVSGASATET